MAAILDPSAAIQLLVLGTNDNSMVPKLQVFAAAVFQKQLLASIQEAEEFMKLLGTHQMHGRVFARLAYNSDQPASTTGSDNVYETYANMPPTVRENLMKEHLAGKRVGSISRPITNSARSSDVAGPSRHVSASPMKGVLASVSYMGGKPLSSSSNFPNLSSATYSQGASSKSQGAQVDRGSSKSNPSDQSSHPNKTMARADTIIREWLSYDAYRRKLNDTGSSANNARATERSTLAQLRSEDDKGFFQSALSCFRGSQTVHRAPMVGEDVCGLCHDNKPLLQMMRCEHRTCLLCAKSMTYLLDMQQLVLCPYCGEIVESFGLA